MLLRLSLAVVCGLLTAMTSLLVEHGLKGASASIVAALRLLSTDSIVEAHWLSCSTACEIFPDQRSSSCLLHWQVDSLPLSHRGNPTCLLVMTFHSLTIHRPPELGFLINEVNVIFLMMCSLQEGFSFSYHAEWFYHKRENNAYQKMECLPVKK